MTEVNQPPWQNSLLSEIQALPPVDQDAQLRAFMQTRDAQLRTPLHVICMAKTGHALSEQQLADEMQVYLAYDAQVTARDCHGKMPLHFAARNNYMLLCQVLIEADRSCVFSKDYIDHLPLNYAKAQPLQAYLKLEMLIYQLEKPQRLSRIPGLMQTFFGDKYQSDCQRRQADLAAARALRLAVLPGRTAEVDLSAHQVAFARKPLSTIAPNLLPKGHFVARRARTVSA